MGAMDPDVLEVKSAPYPEEKILNAGAGGGEGRLYTDSNKETCRISSTSYKRTKLVYDSLSLICTFHSRVSLFGCGEDILKQSLCLKSKVNFTNNCF